MRSDPAESGRVLHFGSAPLPRFDVDPATSAEMTGLQLLLRRCPTAADRKALIIEAHCLGALAGCETELLIQAYMLETA